MKKTLELITKWLKDSGLKVNKAKTEMSLFHRSNIRIINISINNVIIKKHPQINVLGITFDSKLQWTEQISKTIKEANKNLQPIRIISKYFNPEELKNFDYI